MFSPPSSIFSEESTKLWVWLPAAVSFSGNTTSTDTESVYGLQFELLEWWGHVGAYTQNGVQCWKRHTRTTHLSPPGSDIVNEVYTLGSRGNLKQVTLRQCLPPERGQVSDSRTRYPWWLGSMMMQLLSLEDTLTTRLSCWSLVCICTLLDLLCLLWYAFEWDILAASYHFWNQTPWLLPCAGIPTYRCELNFAFSKSFPF